MHKIQEHRKDWIRLKLGLAHIWSGLVILCTLGRYESDWVSSILKEIILRRFK